MRYLVIKESELTPAILGKLKNYYRNQDYIFIEDTPQTLGVRRVRQTGEAYVILKIADRVPALRVRQFLANHEENSTDKFRRIYLSKLNFREFLQENFDE